MKKYIIAAVAAVVVFALSAFAASLDVNAGTLQAGDNSIGECTDEGVVVTYGTPTFTNGAWQLDKISLSNPDCSGKSFSVVVTGETDEATPVPWTSSTATGVFTAGAVEVTFSPAFNAQQAEDVHVVIRNAS